MTEKLNSLLDCVTTVLYLDRSGRVIATGDSFEGVVGHSDEQVRGMRLDEFLVGPMTDLYAIHTVEHCVKTEQGACLQTWCYRQDGERFLASIVVDPVFVTPGVSKHCPCVITDLDRAARRIVQSQGSSQEFE